VPLLALGGTGDGRPEHTPVAGPMPNRAGPGQPQARPAEQLQLPPRSCYYSAGEQTEGLLRERKRNLQLKLVHVLSTTTSIKGYLPNTTYLEGYLVTVTVPLDRWSRSYSPGGRGAGNGVAARSQLYERSNRKRQIADFIVSSSETWANPRVKEK
jgi:hypothetical protein